MAAGNSRGTGGVQLPDMWRTTLVLIFVGGLYGALPARARPQWTMPPPAPHVDENGPRYNVIVWPTGPEGAPAPLRYQVHISGRNHSSSRKADGSYLIPNIPPGHYKLTSMARNDSEYFGEGFATFDVTNADVTLHVALAGLGEIEGAAKTDHTQAGIPAGVMIEISSRESGLQASHMDAAGHFTFDRVLPGEYTFSTLENPDGIVVRSVKCAGEAVTSQLPLLVGDRQKISGCEVVLGYEFSASSAAQPVETANSLIAQFTQASFFNQRDLAEKLAALNDPSVLPELEPLLQSNDMRVRGNTAFVFAKLGDDRGFQAIQGILEDRSRSTKRTVHEIDDAGQLSIDLEISRDRMWAIGLLGMLKDRRAVPLLVPLLNDEEINSDVPWALGEIGDRSADPPLIAMLSDKRADRRMTAILALERLNAKEALPQLRALLTDNERIHFDGLGPVSSYAKSAIAKIEASPQ